MIFRQCELSSGNSRMITWLVTDTFQAGDEIRLENSSDPERWWRVHMIGSLGLNKEQVKFFERDYKLFQGSTRGGGID